MRAQLTGEQRLALMALTDLAQERRRLEGEYEMRMRQLTRLGVSQSEIARWLGVSSNAVRQYLMRRSGAVRSSEGAVDGDKGWLTRSQRVFVLERFDIAVAYFAMAESEATFELDYETWESMGSPEKVTVTVEPGGLSASDGRSES